MTAALLREIGALTLDDDRPDVELPTGAGWEAFWADARDERAVAVVAQALHDGRLHGTAAQHVAIVDAHEASMIACLRLERVALDVTADLAGVGIDTRLLKGAATAHLDYDDPAWRSFGDVDLLVRADDYDAAVDRLCARGARRRSAEPRPGFDRRFGKGVCLVRPDDVQVDLHRSLAAGPFGMTIEPEELFAGAEPLPLGDATVAALDCEGRFLHACFHAALGDFPPSITALRDVARHVRAGRVDLVRARDLAQRWRAGVVVASAVATAWSVFGLPRSAAVEWAFTYVPSRYERSALAAYLGSGRSYARQMVAAIPAIHGVRPKLSYVSALLFADASYVAGRDGGYVRRLRRAARHGFDTRTPR